MSMVLPYGDGEVPLARLGLSHVHLDPLSPPHSTTARKPVDWPTALEAPIGSAPLEAFLAGAESVLLILPDATRATGIRPFMGRLYQRLSDTGRSVRILLAGGLHRAVTAAEQAEILGSELAASAAVLQHDAGAPDQLAYLGTTGPGTPVYVNRQLLEVDRLVVVGAVGFHYFAGYSGGRKGLIPGAAGAGTIAANHRRVVDGPSGRHPGCRPGVLDGNPVHRDLVAACRLIPTPVFLINTVFVGGAVAGCFCGDLEQAHRAACQALNATHRLTVPEPRPLLVLSCGGAPRDINLIQAHKALDLCQAACQPGGTIILVARCPDGLGSPGMQRWVGQRTLEDHLAELQRNYQVYGQTALSLRRKAARYRIRVWSELEDEVLEGLGMAGWTPEQATAIPLETRGWLVREGSTVLLTQTP